MCRTFFLRFLCILTENWIVNGRNAYRLSTCLQRNACIGVVDRRLTPPSGVRDGIRCMLPSSECCYDHAASRVWGGVRLLRQACVLAVVVWGFTWVVGCRTTAKTEPVAAPTPTVRSCQAAGTGTNAAATGMDRQIGEMAVEDQQRASRAYPPPAEPTKRYRDEPIRHNRRPR